MKIISNEELCILVKSGDGNACSLLIKNNMGFIHKIAYELYKKINLSNSEFYIDIEDLEQEGCIALLNSAKLFDESKGIKFLTYAAQAIHNSMTDIIRDVLSSYEQRISNNLGIQIIRLDDILSDDEKLKRIESIANPFTKNPEEYLIEQETIHELYTALERLSPREQTYLLYRYGFIDGLPHSRIETATHFHLSENRARKTEEQSMDNLWLELPWWF